MENKKIIANMLEDGEEVRIVDLTYSPKLRELLKGHENEIYADNEGCLFYGDEEVLDIWGGWYDEEEEGK